MKITEFLLARIAEDEDTAREALPKGPFLAARNWIAYDQESGVLIDAHRVLGECEAKRHLLDESPVWGEGCASVIGQYMAEVYDGHPDYREEWRP